MRAASSTVLGVVAGACLLAGPAFAAGLEVGDQGAEATGRGGAFTAKADDPTAIYYNPAGLTHNPGTHFLYTHRIVYSPVEFRRARTLDWSGVVGGVPKLVDFEHVKNEVPLFPLGMMFAAQSDFGLEDWSFGLGVYGPPGIGHVKYPDDGPQRYMLTEMDVMILYYTASVAWKYEEIFGLGVSLQWVDVPQLEFAMVTDGTVSPKLVNPVESRFDIETQIKGEDRIGATAIVGAWFRPVPELEIAVAGRVVPVEIDATADISLRALFLTLDEPIQPTRNGVPTDEVHFKMMLPPKLRLGLRYAYLDGKEEVFDLELGLHYEMWSLVENFTMEANIDTEVLGQVISIGTINIPKHWHDTVTVRAGGDYNVVPDWFTLRAGFFYESAAVPKGYAYLDTMSNERFGPSLGFTVRHWGVELSAAYTFVYQEPLVVTEAESRVSQQVPASPCQAPFTDTSMCHPQYIGRGAAAANAGTYVEDYHIVNVSLSYGF